MRWEGIWNPCLPEGHVLHITNLEICVVARFQKNLEILTITKKTGLLMVQCAHRIQEKENCAMNSNRKKTSSWGGSYIKANPKPVKYVFRENAKSFYVSFHWKGEGLWYNPPKRSGEQKQKIQLQWTFKPVKYLFTT